MAAREESGCKEEWLKINWFSKEEWIAERKSS
jgi:hypothetical protein